MTEETETQSVTFVEDTKMPCGGIETIEPLVDRNSWEDDCAQCGEFIHPVSGEAPNHQVYEWGYVLHGGCVLEWLDTDEGYCVHEHKHQVELNGVIIFREGIDR